MRTCACPIRDVVLAAEPAPGDPRFTQPPRCEPVDPGQVRPLALRTSLPSIALEVFPCTWQPYAPTTWPPRPERAVCTGGRTLGGVTVLEPEGSVQVRPLARRTTLPSSHLDGLSTRRAPLRAKPSGRCARAPCASTRAVLNRNGVFGDRGTQRREPTARRSGRKPREISPNPEPSTILRRRVQRALQRRRVGPTYWRSAAGEARQSATTSWTAAKLSCGAVRDERSTRERGTRPQVEARRGRVGTGVARAEHGEAAER
jgi:hypothetical protein